MVGLSGSATPPRGATPPRPGLGMALLRTVLGLALAVSLLRAPLGEFAAGLTRHTTTASTRPELQPAGLSPALPAPPSAEQAAGTALGLLLAPALAPWLRLLALAALLGCGAELLLAALAMPLQARAVRERGRAGTYLSIRRPVALQGGAEPSGSGMEVFRTLAGSFPAGGRLSGSGAWCALTLGAGPDQPAELGAFIPAGRGHQRARSALVNALQGLCADVSIDERDDPLRSAAQGGTVVAWREYGLALPPEFPLRLLEPNGGADPLGPLAAAIRPSRARYAELQIVIRPIGGIAGWALGRGWRGRATARKLALEARADYGLQPDIAALETKLAGASFEVTVRAAVVCEQPGDAQAALDQIEAALATFQARIASHVQRLVPVASGAVRTEQQKSLPAALARAPRYAPPAPFLLPLRPWRDPDILTPSELGGLWHLPSAELAGLLRPLGSRRLPAPPHAFVGGTNGAEPRVTLGLARRGSGDYAPVGPTLRDLRQILHLTAGMGAGKSRLLANLCAQLVPHGFTLLDGKGDDRDGSLVATVRRLIPPADEGRLIILDVLDADWPVGLNPLARADLARPGGLDLALGQVLALFARLDPETWGKAVGMQQFATMATLLVLHGETRPTLAHIKQALLDEDYRARLLEHTRDAEVTTFWRDTFPRLGEGQRSSRDALLRRIDMLLTAETTRLLVTQSAPTLDFQRAIEQGQIVLVPVPDMTLGGLAGAVAMLVFQAFVAAAFARGGTDASRVSYPLVVDELQVLLGQSASQDVETAITRLRSLGIPSVYAHQALGQLGDLADLMMINAGSRVILQTGEPDASTYARAYAASGLTAADIAGQEPLEHQYAALRCNGATTGVFSMRPLPWPAPLPAEPAAYDGPDWRSVLPEPADPLDATLARLAYTPVNEARAVAELVALNDAEWERVVARWDVLRLFQRGYILRHPGCIPDRLERQRWLSRLLAARPRLLAAAEYARARA
jgi:hypothetical protein